MISREVLSDLFEQAKAEMLEEGEAGKPFWMYFLGFVAGANLATDGQPHTVSTILEHIILDFKKALRHKGDDE